MIVVGVGGWFFVIALSAAAAEREPLEVEE